MASLPICLCDVGSGEEVGCDKGEGAVRRTGSGVLVAALPAVVAAAAALGTFVEVLDCMLPELPCL